MKMTGTVSADGRCIVFAGPTISPAEAKDVLDAVYLPPASQGSVFKAVAIHRPKTILLIDGAFQSEPAVRHKELMWAASRGISIVGAASMGAMRAAELPGWMSGIGLIYRWYRRYVLAPDDAVAVLHAPPEAGGHALTTALVDIQRSLRKAEKHKVISCSDRKAATKVLRELPYQARTYRTMFDWGGLPAMVQCRLVSWLEDPNNLIHQKREDALQALRMAAVGKISRSRQVVFVPTAAFMDDAEMVGASPDLDPPVPE